jgi:nitrite reductase/ring-hydroxylating ferredoxin subunit
VVFFLVKLAIRRLARLVAGRSAAAALEVENAVLQEAASAFLIGISPAALTADGIAVATEAADNRASKEPPGERRTTRSPGRQSRTEVDRRRTACQCHGSRFDVTSGAALKGPAVQTLAPLRVRGSRFWAPL